MDKFNLDLSFVALLGDSAPEPPWQGAFPGRDPPCFQRMIRGIGNQRVVLDLISNMKRAQSNGYFHETSRASDNSTWAIHGKQKNGDEE